MTLPSNLEIEQKFRVDDFQAVHAKILDLECIDRGELEQRDEYFSHPCRNFKKTDEALRIRYEGDRAILTYKGPKLAGPIKSREELEWPFEFESTKASQDPNPRPPIGWLLQRLGFLPIATVRKHRQWFHLLVDQIKVAVSLDQVEQLGCFVEIESVCLDSQRAAHETAIRSIAQQLGLEHPITASYLGMLKKLEP